MLHISAWRSVLPAAHCIKLVATYTDTTVIDYTHLQSLTYMMAEGAGSVPIHLYLGPPLIGTFFNIILYTVEVVAVIVYFRTPRAKKERRHITWAVIFNLIVDTIGSFSVCAGAYAYCVIFWGNGDRIRNTHWTLITNLVTNAVATFVVQGFLTYRYWKLSSNKYITVFIFCLMLFGWAGDIHLAIRSSHSSRTPDDRLTDTRDVVIALAGTAAADISITIALTWTLFSTKTLNRATKSLVKRIMTVAIVTGAVTSFAAIVVLITFLVLPLSRVSTCFTLFLGRIYTLTMLYVLIHRDAISQGLMSVVVDSEGMHSTTETACNDASRNRPFSSHSDAIVFSQHHDTFPSIQSHSTPDFHQDDYPKRVISRLSDTLYNHKNDSIV